MTAYRIGWILTLLVCVLMGLGFVFEQQLEQQLREQHYQERLQILDLIRGELDHRPPFATLDYDEVANRLGEHSKARVTLIGTRGQVLGDSSISASALSKLDNHNERPEVQQALKGEIGYHERTSDTLQQSMHYLAALSSDGLLVVRVAFSGEHLNQAIQKLRILVILLCTLLLGTIGGLWIYSLQFVAQSVRAEKQRLEHELDEHHNELRTLQAVSEVLGACISLKEVGDVVEGYFRQLLGQHSSMLAVMRSSRDRIEPAAHWGPLEIAHPFGPNDCWALRLGRTHLDDGVEHAQHCNHRDNEKDGTQGLCIPLVARGEILGSLNLELPACWRPDPERLAFCESLAKQVSLTLANIQLNESLRQQAIRDALTGLYNRRFLTESLEAEINRAERHNHPLSLLMLDLDHFKRINDRFGHETGDKALRAFALGMKRNCRREDIPCRYGGEEFCMLLPETDSESAVAVAEKLRHATGQIDVRAPSGELIPITVSIGVAAWGQGCHDLDSLLSAADEALYQAKAEGRNRVVLAEVADATTGISLEQS